VFIDEYNPGGRQFVHATGGISDFLEHRARVLTESWGASA
jgi:hypothetical protein